MYSTQWQSNVISSCVRSPSAINQTDEHTLFQWSFGVNEKWALIWFKSIYYIKLKQKIFPYIAALFQHNMYVTAVLVCSAITVIKGLRHNLKSKDKKFANFYGGKYVILSISEWRNHVRGGNIHTGFDELSADVYDSFMISIRRLCWFNDLSYTLLRGTTEQPQS